MATNINYAFVSFVSTVGGPLLKVENDATLTDTRIHGVHATGVGTFTINDVVDGTSTTKIKFVNTTAIRRQPRFTSKTLASALTVSSMFPSRRRPPRLQFSTANYGY